jgi:hypothetical protein
MEPDYSAVGILHTYSLCTRVYRKLVQIHAPEYIENANPRAVARARVARERVPGYGRYARVYGAVRRPSFSSKMMWLRLLGCASWTLCCSAGSPSTDPNMNGDYQLSKTPGVCSAIRPRRREQRRPLYIVSLLYMCSGHRHSQC